MIENKKLVEEILILLKDQKLYKVILFGSYAYKKPHDDSDIDLLVILDKNGVSNNYKKILENKKLISKQLRALRKRVPIDLLVYTKDEWKILQDCKTSFFKQVEKEGVALI
ncbi:MAG: nucleotidyltransferase domain-containing protein [Candidatus Anammoxibacter sp.]